MKKNGISVMLAMICNPYIAVYQKLIYEKYWKDEVDELYINVNGRNDQIRNFIVDLWASDDKVKHVDEVASEIRQGTAFDRLYPLIDCDILMTMDSDNFIYAKNVINEYTAVIKGGAKDSVGSTGNHAFPWENAKPLVERNGCVRLNPFMAFFRKSIVDKIKNIDFGSTSLKKGEHSELLQCEIPVDGHIDVMGEFCIKFFQLSQKYTKIPPANPGQYVHMFGVSSIFRRNFKKLEDTNEQKFDERQATRQDLGYWVNYYILYEATKTLVPFPEYNKEYEKAFEFQLKKSSYTMSDVKNASDKFKKIHNGML